MIKRYYKVGRHTLNSFPNTQSNNNHHAKQKSPPLQHRKPRHNPITRINSRTLPNLHLLLRILQLHRKLAHRRRNQTCQFRLRKPLPNTAPGPLQESQHGIVVRRAAGVIGTAGVSINPPVWVECARVGTPEFFVEVESVHGDHEKGVFGDWGAGDDGVATGYARSGGYGGVEAEDFVADGIEVGEGVEGCGRERRGGRRGRRDGGEVGADFVAETGLDIRVLAEGVDGPLQGCGGCFVAGCEEGHHLVDQVFFREGAALEGDGDDVDAVVCGGTVVAFHLFFLLANDLPGHAADNRRAFLGGFVAPDGQFLEKFEIDHEQA